MTKKTATKPQAKLTPQKPEAPSAPPAPEYHLVSQATRIDSIQAVLTFRNPDPAAINRPVSAEQAALAMAKELPSVKRWFPLREEIERNKELLRTSEAVLRDDERRYEDATGDDDLVALAYGIDASRLAVKEARENLDRLIPIARKAWDAARQEYGQFFSSEQNRLNNQAKSAYENVAAEVVPQICALVSRLAEAKCHHQTLLRMAIPNVVDVIGAGPAEIQASTLPARQPVTGGPTIIHAAGGTAAPIPSPNFEYRRGDSLQEVESARAGKPNHRAEKTTEAVA